MDWSYDAGVEGERPFTIYMNRSGIHCCKGEIVWGVLMVCDKVWSDTHF